MNHFLTQFSISASSVGVQKVEADAVLSNILNIVYYLAGGIAVIVIIVAGIMYITSTGDTGRVTKAKNMIVYSIVGLIFVALAFIITNYVIGVFN